MFPRLINSVIAIALIVIGLSAHASSVSTSFMVPDNEDQQTARKWTGEYSLALGGEDFTQGKDEGTAASLFFKTSFEGHFSKFLRVYVAPIATLYTGRLQQRYETDDYKSRIGVTEFYLSSQPIKQIDLRAGAVNQEYLNSPMLISKHRAFPGLEQIIGDEWNSKNNRFKGQVIFQESIPTSYSLNTEREDREPLPEFFVQSIHLSGKAADWFEWQAMGGHFTYNHLPNEIAFQSRLLGNSTNDTDAAPGTHFLAGFDGFFGGMEVCACVPTWPVQAIVEYQRIYNHLADSGLGNGQIWGIGPRFIFGDLTLDIRYRRFFIEKDATVAYYMTSFIGNTNRMGDDVEFKLDFRDQKFAVVGEWANAETIRDNPLQQTITSVYLGVETHYVPFW